MRFKVLDAKIRMIDRARKGKWAKLAAGTPKVMPDCVLCDKYATCDECPIGFVTGDGCTGTPQNAHLAVAEIPCGKCRYQGSGNTCERVREEECLIDASRPKAKKHARRESKMLGAIQKGLEVMQRELAKIK